MSYLPPSLQTPIHELRHAPLRDPAELRQAVLAHLDAVRAAAATSAFVDRALAERIATSLLAALDAWADLTRDERPWLQAAAGYFSRPDVGEHDFDSIVGFDDDAEVLNHVLDRLGRPDLRIELD